LLFWAEYLFVAAIFAGPPASHPQGTGHQAGEVHAFGEARV